MTFLVQDPSFVSFEKVGQRWAQSETWQEIEPVIFSMYIDLLRNEDYNYEIACLTYLAVCNLRR